jgi:hypothetical protein
MERGRQGMILALTDEERDAPTKFWPTINVWML